jgi:hypothetical protein
MQLGLQPCTANDVLNENLIMAILMEQTYTRFTVVAQRPRVLGMRRSKCDRWPLPPLGTL